MKKLFFAIVAMFLLMGVNSNVIAQNPVKKVKYMKHVYEGEVGKKKVPEGRGTMFFDGFTVQGDFQGNEVTNATLSIDNSDITYNGNLSFDESQNVTLKHGGEIKTFLYAKYYRNSYLGTTEISKYTPYVIETISTDKNVSINFFNKSEIDFQYTVSADWKDEIKKFLNPPVITQTFHKTAMPIKVRYRFNENEEKYEIIELDDKPFNPIVWKLKTIYCLDFLEDVPQKNVRNVVGYKDDKGRVWTCKEDSIKVLYPNGSYMGFDVSDLTKGDDSYDIDKSYNFKIIRPDNIVISKDGKCEFYDSDNKIVADVFCDTGVGKDLEKVIAVMDTTRLLRLPSKYFFGNSVNIYNSENLSPKDIENILGNQVFSKFKIEERDGRDFSYYGVKLPSNLEHLKYKDLIKVYGIRGEERSEIGYYVFQERKYFSDSQLKRDADIEDNKSFDRLLAPLGPIKNRFGFNPLGRGLKDIVKVGTSFKLISDYFRLTKKYFYCYRGQSIYFKDTFPGEEFIDLSWGKLSELADEKKIDGGGYYYTHLSIDHGTRKCYDLGYFDRFDQSRRICYVWVTGDKITSVVWY